MTTQSSEGRITDESVEQMRMLIGYPNPTIRTGQMVLPWNTVATSDAIRHFAECSYGDTNPLYTSAEYATGTRWGKHIAPPGFELTMGYDRSPATPDDLRDKTRGVLRSVQLYNSGRDAYYYRPIAVGDELYKSIVVHDVEDKSSSFAGRSVLVTNEATWVNHNAETVCVVYPWYIHAERRRASERTDHQTRSAEPAYYTDEELTAIEAAYDDEFLRGGDPWYWEDVVVGERLPTMVKGPLTVTDQINFYMGAGWTSYGNPPLRLAYENRKRMRRFYTRNEFNAWDSLQRVHWDLEQAQSVGVKMLYDIGPMRFAWTTHYCTSLAGDDGWVYRVRSELRSFNYAGDTTWLSGEVADKRVDPSLGPLVDITIRGVNQRGAENITGQATILVPSHQHGPVELPSPPHFDVPTTNRA